MYSEKVMKHFLHPHNVGEIKNPDAVGKAGNVICGDVMYLYIKVKKQKQNYIIKDIKFKTLGCGAAIATSSITTDLAKGKTFEQALKIKNQNIVRELDSLPVAKIHCSILAVKALREAIYAYLLKNKLPIPEELKKTHKQVKKELDISEKRYTKLIKGRNK